MHWIFKNKEHGKTSATASLGLISLWDVEGGLPLIDKYLYSSDNAVVAGALLAIGLVNCGVQNENDPGEVQDCTRVLDSHVLGQLQGHSQKRCGLSCLAVGFPINMWSLLQSSILQICPGSVDTAAVACLISLGPAEWWMSSKRASDLLFAVVALSRPVLGDVVSQIGSAHASPAASC